MMSRAGLFLLCSALALVASIVNAESLTAKDNDKVDFKNPVRPAEQDQVTNLPGLSDELATFKHFSGYLEADKHQNRFWHYWFVESQSAPATDPLVLWLNGGPGCSSMLGFLTELGPFRVAANGSLIANEFSWNKRANVLFMESPAGVGYSYAADGSLKADDDSTATQNHQALKSFLRKFPRFKNSPLYLTGESYAGVYLPTLASLVDLDEEMNLRGVAIGNGYLDAKKLAESLVYFSYYHGLVGRSTWEGLSRCCCDGKPPARGQCKFTAANRSPECSVYVTQATDAILNSGVNPYNLYDRCATSTSLSSSASVARSATKSQTRSREREHVDKSLILAAFNVSRPSNSNQQGGLFKKTHLPTSKRSGSPSSIKFHVDERLSSDPPCTDSSTSVNFLNRADVRSALHIPEEVAKFTECADLDYTMIYPGRPGGLAPQMRQLIDSKRKPTLLVYNGDVDLMCNFFGDEWFVDDLNRKVLQDYEPWYTNNQVSGFVKYFDRITFVTVKGSGHMVPTDRPAEALHMFDMFLDGMKPNAAAKRNSV